MGKFKGKLRLLLVVKVALPGEMALQEEWLSQHQPCENVGSKKKR